MTIPKLFWNARAFRWQTADGRFVKQAAVDKAIARLFQANTRRALTLGRTLVDNPLATASFRTSMRELVKTNFLQSLMLAKGGRAQLTQADFGRLGAALKFQYKRLDQFAAQLAAGDSRWRPGTLSFIRRIKAYANAARLFFESTQMKERGRLGWLVQNVMSAAEHCQRSKRRPDITTCPEETAKGKVPVDEMSPPGTRACGAFCLCKLKYSRP